MSGTSNFEIAGWLSNGRHRKHESENDFSELKLSANITLSLIMSSFMEARAVSRNTPILRSNQIQSRKFHRKIFHYTLSFMIIMIS